MLVALLALPSVALAANPAANLDQCRNGGVATPQTFTQCTGGAWVNGNAGAHNSHFREGESISYRASVTNLTAGNIVTLDLGYDVIHSHRYAIDYLTDKNGWQSPETSVAATPDVPCSGVSPCAGPVNAPITAPPGSIHVDPTKNLLSGCIGTATTGTGPLQPATSFGAQPAGREVMEFFNVSGTPATKVEYLPPTPDFSAPNGGDQEQQIRLTFTATASQVEIAWGGHIASRLEWGCANLPVSAGGISGSPYHMRLKDMTVNGAHVNLGNQDRSLSAQAVVAPFTLIINKIAMNGDDTFGYTASGQGLSNFSLTTSGGTASRGFSNLTAGSAGGTRTVTENTPPADWTFTSLSCTVVTPGDGTTAFSTSGATVTVTNGGEGAVLSCTYTNTRGTAILSLTKTPSTTNVCNGSNTQVTYTYVVTNTGTSRQRLGLRQREREHRLVRAVGAGCQRRR